MIEHKHLLLTLFLLSGCASAGSTSEGGSIASAGFGSFTLAPGESRSFRTGAIYREIRVCNDVGSSGTVEATVSSGTPMQLAPGICARENGDNLTLHNISTGTVTGAFHSYGGKPIGKNGR
jgi:hypothetical protein